MATEAEVLRIARLARIHLNSEELESTRLKFSAILEHVAHLNACPTEGVVPLFHAIEQNIPREDIPEPAIERDSLLRNAPDQLDGCFRLPKVVKGL